MHGQSRMVGPLRTKIGPNIKEHLLNKLRDLPFGIIVSVALQGISWQSEQSNTTLVRVYIFCAFAFWILDGANLQ